MIALPTALAALALFTARIAIISSSNEAAGQARLRYAERDGEKMAAVLTELGSVAPDDVWRLPHATVAELRAALDRAEARAAREPGSTIVVYYSGHADAEGLLLGGERFPYRELRDRLARSHAQVRVAVLDGCNAGAATQTKGGHAGAGLAFASVDPLRVDGAAILAAAGSDELAQEASDVGGSYFTHHLISALRGAGDRDGDGVVTLGEAYGYVYARTVAATAPSLWGPQHPAYDYRLSGTGDLALTRLGRMRQALIFAAADDGGIYTVVDARTEVAAEVRADPRRAVRLALGPGRYRVTLRADGRVSSADVSLMSQSEVLVNRADLKPVRPELAFAKGGPTPPQDAIFVDYGLAGRGPSTAAISSELGLLARREIAGWALAGRVSFGQASYDDDGLSYRLRRLTATAYALAPIRSGTVDLQLGPAVAVTRAWQTLSNGRALQATVPWAGGAVALELPIAGWLAARVAWDAGVELVHVDGDWRARFALRGMLGVGLRR